MVPHFGPRRDIHRRFPRRRATPTSLVEITTLNPVTGEPAHRSHPRRVRPRHARRHRQQRTHRARLRRICATKPARASVEFRFESTVMDGAPVFNLVRNNLPGVNVLGFTGVLNSTSKVVIETMEQGGTFEEGMTRRAAGNRRSRCQLRHRRLGLRRQNRRAGQRSDGRAHHAARCRSPRHRAPDARTHAEFEARPAKPCAWSAAPSAPAAASRCASAPKCWIEPTFWPAVQAPPICSCSIPT